VANARRAAAFSRGGAACCTQQQALLAKIVQIDRKKCGWIPESLARVHMESLARVADARVRHSSISAAVRWS
jgi:hypothetical protein